MITIIALIAMLHTPLLLVAESCVSSITAFLTAPYTAWFPVVILAVLAVISILSVIYAIGPFIGSINSIRPWVKVKIYELLLSIILILIFASIATSLCTADPYDIFSSVGLVSSQCTPTSTSTPVSNLYSLAMCNMYQFNGYVGEFNEFIYLTVMAYAISPVVIAGPFALGSGTTTAGSGKGVGFQPIPGSPAGAVFTTEFMIDPASLLTKANKFEPFIINAMYVFTLLTQLQLILLAASPYLFAFFMAIGLIARAFGATRTFGGAMIAFGIGIGFIYPVMTSLTYGFLDHAIEHTSTTSLLAPLVSPLITGIDIITGTYLGTALPAALNSLVESIFMSIGLILVGVIFINLLNFMILDAFIADFSQALGERMDFLSLLTNVI